MAIFYYFISLITIGLTVSYIIINSMALIALIAISFSWIINYFLVFSFFFADLILFALLFFTFFKIYFYVGLRICCFILIKKALERLIIPKNIFTIFRPWFININSSKFVILIGIVINKTLIIIKIIKIAGVKIINIAIDFFIFLIILGFAVIAGFVDNINIFVPEI